MNALDCILILVAVALTLWANEVVRAVDWSITWFSFHRVCGWCQRHQGGNPFAKPTHGICPKCAEEMARESRELHESETEPKPTGSTGLAG